MPVPHPAQRFTLYAQRASQRLPPEKLRIKHAGVVGATEFARPDIKRRRLDQAVGRHNQPVAERMVHKIGVRLRTIYIGYYG